MEQVKQLLNKVSYGFDTTSIDQDGNTNMTIGQCRNATFPSNENNSMPIPNNETHLLTIFFLSETQRECFKKQAEAGMILHAACRANSGPRLGRNYALQGQVHMQIRVLMLKMEDQRC